MVDALWEDPRELYLRRMPLNNSGSPSQPILHRVGLVGAAARFYQRSYAADYIALGFLAMGWLLVSQYLYLAC